MVTIGPVDGAGAVVEEAAVAGAALAWALGAAVATVGGDGLESQAVTKQSAAIATGRLGFTRRGLRRRPCAVNRVWLSEQAHRPWRPRDLDGVADARERHAAHATVLPREERLVRILE